MSALVWGVACAQGERASMEDAHRIVERFDWLVKEWRRAEREEAALRGESSIPPSPSPPASLSSHPYLGGQAYFGVYDGHGGREAAEFVRDHLHINVAKRIAQVQNTAAMSSLAASSASSSSSSSSIPHRHEPIPMDLASALQHGVSDTESALLAHCVTLGSSAGAVIAIALFDGMQLYIAHAGDSRAVLCRSGQALELTVDHKAGEESEVERIHKLGGFIEDGCLNGEICVSRALGDLDLETGEKMKGLSAEAQCAKFHIQEEDEFIIIACDGLWDVLSSEAAVGYARRSLRHHNDIQRCAEDLVKEALAANSTDNVSVILIGFTRTVSETQPQHPSGDVRVIVPAEPRRLAGSSYYHRHLHLHGGEREKVQPRPRRLQFSKVGLEKLMKALQMSDDTSTSTGTGEEEKKQQGKGEGEGGKEAATEVGQNKNDTEQSPPPPPPPPSSSL